MKLFSSEQMRALDRYVIETLDIPGPLLMERAGAGVAEQALGMCYDYPGPIVVLCGKGNNGGDGLVAARLLRQDGYPVQVILPFAPDTLAPDARLMYDRALAAGVVIAPGVSDEELSGAGIIIDALLGTGITGAVQGVLADLIMRTNRLRGGRGVLAVDVPSGVLTDTGQIAGPAICATCTVTIAAPKPCLLLHPGAELAGQWVVVDIGFPRELVTHWSASAEVTEAEHAAAWLPKRPPTAHKMGVGAALVIAGSFGMTGAAAMAVTAAYRGGAGLVRLAMPAALVPPLNAAHTEVVFRPMPATTTGTLSFRALPLLLAEAAEVRATLLGPGLSCQPAVANLVRHLTPRISGPLVIDADALTALAGHDEVWEQRTSPTIITPHPGEMSRLLGQPVAELERDRLSCAREAARRFNAVVVYKGTPAIIAAPDGRLLINPTGNAGLAVAGTGDVLAGLITALLAQRVEPFEAAALACYVGGRAAELLTATLGLHGMTALDLIDGIPYALLELHG